MFYVYTLADPRDDNVHYIGVTRYPALRMYQHLYTQDGNEGKLRWVQGLFADGIEPVMLVLETVDTWELALERERYWIKLYLEQKAPLVNRALPAEKKVMKRAYWGKGGRPPVSLPLDKCVFPPPVVDPDLENLDVIVCKDLIVVGRLASSSGWYRLGYKAQLCKPALYNAVLGYVSVLSLPAQSISPDLLYALLVLRADRFTVHCPNCSGNLGWFDASYRRAGYEQIGAIREVSTRHRCFL